jgi:hypothetical protein
VHCGFQGEGRSGGDPNGRWVKEQWHKVNRKRVQRLVRVLGLAGKSGGKQIMQTFA